MTVTEQVAVKLPSSVVTVMVAVPAATAVTLPVLSTVATLVSLEDQVTFLLVALAGFTVATRVAVAPPTVRVSVLWSRVTPVTGTVYGVVSFTVTVRVASAPALKVKVNVTSPTACSARYSFLMVTVLPDTV